MALHRIKDFDPDYRNHFDQHDVKGLDLYTGNEKIGTVDDILVDDGGQLRYLLVNTGLWILGKKVLFPIGLARIDYDNNRVYADKLTKVQVEALPEYTEDKLMGQDYEEQVRDVYRPSKFNSSQENPANYGVGYGGASDPQARQNQETPVNYGVGYSGVESPTLVENKAAMGNEDGGYVNPNPSAYSYEQEPDLYALTESNHPSLKLYQERLVANKTRQKTGEAVISKRIETETATASISLDKERVVVEQMPVTGDTVIAPGEATFQGGEVSRIEVYEEVPAFQKEAFVREEVRVSKVVDQETATAEENLRREELDVNTDGSPVIDRAK